MSNRIDEIKKRIASRKKMKVVSRPSSFSGTRSIPRPDYYGEKPNYFESKLQTTSTTSESFHPLFKKEVFLFKILISACLFLIVGIIFQQTSIKELDPVRVVIKDVMESEFQFASVSKWYEDTFGKPLVFLPNQNKDNEEDKQGGYALPANAVIVEEFDNDNQGVTIQTSMNEPVRAIDEGLVTFSGNLDGYGNLVRVQLPDKSEIWYGQLSEIKVHVYQSVKAGDVIGIVSNNEGGTTGEFYIAIKKDEKFIDPIQVIKIE